MKNPSKFNDPYIFNKRFNKTNLTPSNNPIFNTIAAVSIQLTFLVCFLYYLSSRWAFVSVAYTVINVLILLYIVVKKENPAYKIIWIIIIMAVPMIGGVIYFFFGNKRASKRLDVQISEKNNEYLPLMSVNENIAEKVKAENSRVAGCVSYLQNTCSFPAWENTSSEYYPVGEELYAAMLSELIKAERFIFMEYFILEQSSMWDGIYKVLTDKAAKGVDIRIMYDDMGSLKLLPATFEADMKEKGIKCIAFNPVLPFMNLAMNNRDHRKIMVIDGNVAFTGGINIADEYINKKVKYGHWKDTGLKVEGAAVWNFTEMFLVLWNSFTDTEENIETFRPNSELIENTANNGVVIPFSDSPLDDEPISQNVYVDILNQARDYVFICTPYLIIDNEMQNALQMAAKRGVDVRIATPGIPDKRLIFRVTRANYGPLLSAGVKIFEYTPGFLHAKSFVCDDEIGVVGTINLDFRSLYLHFECGVFLYKTDSVYQIKDDYLNTLEKCREFTFKDTKQSWVLNLFDAIIRVFSPLM